MGYAILRIAKRKTTSATKGMVEHALRETEVANAVAGAPKPIVLAGARTAQEAMQTLAQGIALAKAKGGPQGYTKASTPALDILVTTSREDMQRMTLDEQDDYFKRALKFIASKFGGMANVLTAAIHRDETTPHMQVLVMPLDRTTNRFSSGKMLGGPTDLRKMQDAFHAACGAPFGLSRGERDSKAKHVAIGELYTAMAAGAAPPKFVPVPPAPGLVDRLKPGYQDKQAAHEAALSKNRKARAIVTAQAKVARQIHPKLKAPLAERYREIQRLSDLAAADRAAAEKANDQSGRRLAACDVLDKQVGEKLRVMDAKTAAVLVAKFSKGLAPAYVATLSQNIGIELQAGKDIPDQIRRAGLARTLDEAVALMEKAADGQLLPAAIRRQQLDSEQEQSGQGPAPRPQG